MNKRTIYDAPFSERLPEALKDDESIVGIAEALEKELLNVSGIMKNVLIYARIDELDEDILDILAYDLHVDWYKDSYPIETKRDMIKRSVQVHKKMGTKHAVEMGIYPLFPESEVEEWFEYGGDPHYFRVICDTTRQRITASKDEIINAVKMYKRASSHLEDVIYQTHSHIGIGTHTDYYIYQTPLTGRLEAGTYPIRATKGAQTDGLFAIETGEDAFMYMPPVAGTVPERAVRFADTGANVAIKAAAKNNVYTAPVAGDKPDRAVVFDGTESAIQARTSGKATGYSTVPTGQKNAGETPGRSQTAKLTHAAMAGR